MNVFIAALFLVAILALADLLVLIVEEPLTPPLWALFLPGGVFYWRIVLRQK